MSHLCADAFIVQRLYAEMIDFGRIFQALNTYCVTD